MSKTGPEYAESSLKRAFDVTASTGLALAALPVAAALALEARVEHGKAIFAQERIGKAGEPFTLYKFTSLQGDAEPVLHGADHPAVSRLGRFIRNGAFDEMPQFLNILKGDISLVGIRPTFPTALQQQEMADPDTFEEWYECYKLNPGLIGAGQLYSKGFPKHTPEVLRRRMEIDIQAFNDGSFRSDVLAVARTPVPLIRAALRSVVALSPEPAISMPESEMVALSRGKIAEEA